MMSEKVQLEKVLRRALARVEIVTGYRHLCRRGGGHSEAAARITTEVYGHLALGYLEIVVPEERAAAT